MRNAILLFVLFYDICSSIVISEAVDKSEIIDRDQVKLHEHVALFAWLAQPTCNRHPIQFSAMNLAQIKIARVY